VRPEAGLLTKRMGWHKIRATERGYEWDSIVIVGNIRGTKKAKRRGNAI